MLKNSKNMNKITKVTSKVKEGVNKENKEVKTTLVRDRRIKDIKIKRMLKNGVRLST